MYCGQALLVEVQNKVGAACMTKSAGGSVKGASSTETNIVTECIDLKVSLARKGARVAHAEEVLCLRTSPNNVRKHVREL